MRKIQKTIVEARKKWGSVSNENQLLLLTGLFIESGELADAIRNKYVYHKPDVPENDKSSLKHEFADVMIYLAALAEKCNVDLDEAVKSKILLNNKRFGLQR